MLLHTFIYFPFLLVVVVLYWRIQKYRTLFILIVSYLFYATFDLRFIFVLLGLTVTNYLLGRAIASKQFTRFMLVAGVILNLSTLAFFKYTDNVLLPIGISFYTFQAISYLVELSKNKVTLNFIDLAAYLAFFPKLIAGPFVRPASFMQQLHEDCNPPDKSTIQSAVGLFLSGLVKKILIADSLASLADYAFRAANAHSTFTPLYWQGFYLYAFQIYADFAGYTDLARASAMFLGFSLPENFKQPYFASTITVFWNRWHISLTQWFREYLFFPLSRTLLPYTKRWTPGVSNFITMFLIGLWHGATWGFVLWGLFHSVLLSVERLLNVKKHAGWIAILQSIIVFHLVALGWILFRSESLDALVFYLQGMFSFQMMTWFPMFMTPVLITGMLVIGIDIIETRSEQFNSLKPILITASIIIVLVLTLFSIVRGVNDAPFIYASF